VATLEVDGTSSSECYAYDDLLSLMIVYVYLQIPIACGVSGPLSTFADDQQLFAMIQWIAASLARVPHFHFHTSGNSSLIKV
jgi:Poly (ADP-ribose) glycohydrolase (PARG)